MIALDYRLFTDTAYDQLTKVLTALRAAFAGLNATPKPIDTRESNYRFHVIRDGELLSSSLLQQVQKAKYLRLVHQTLQRVQGKTEGIEVLRPNDKDETFDVLAQQVRGFIESGTPALGLDRLHTFMVRYVRNLYKNHFGKTPDEKATLNSLLGQVANDLRSQGLIKSGMASEILRGATRVLEEFNHVRNKQTLAHDNNDLITDAEAYFIYQNVAASVRYLQALGF